MIKTYHPEQLIDAMEAMVATRDVKLISGTSTMFVILP